ncbi:hypothetical protein [Bradyrhizobium sp. CCGUVB23]|uniref:hypothetical protein n=1 Tax=Bradyrhizobium sp. CCGUVB23 TaxID=2949630 RepID=UPI0020B2CC59|nr:hypothetical protein [Bradyrhizobium sp. CCGUVB23]MCP3466956.1 hypothetical protein [Bradyrhizobium sp. CCGUVB23]
MPPARSGHEDEVQHEPARRAYGGSVIIAASGISASCCSRYSMNHYPVTSSIAVKAIASIAVANWLTSFIAFVPQHNLISKRRLVRHVPWSREKIATLSRSVPNQREGPLSHAGVVEG